MEKKRPKQAQLKAPRTWSEWVWRGIGNLPFAVPGALAAGGAVLIALLLMGWFYTLPVIGLGLVASSVVFIYLIRQNLSVRPGSPKEQRWCDLAMLVIIAVWLGFNLLYTSQNVFVYRDPGVYSVTGAWLIDNSNLNIPVDAGFGSVAGINGASSGFGINVLRPGYLIAQGLHLLPALMGAVGRIGGESVMLRIAPLFGATALLAVYGFARLLARPRWAVMTTSSFALSLPLLYFSRDSFSEPLTVTLVFGALALLWLAQTSKRPGVWFLAGLTAGAPAMARADGYFLLIIFALSVGALVALSKEHVKPKPILLMMSGAAITATLGWLDITRLASGYYQSSTGAQVRNQLTALGLVVLVGIVIVPIIRRLRIGERFDRPTKTIRMILAPLGVILLALFFVSRPLWYEAEKKSPGILVGGLQAAASQPINPYRTYAEQNAYWLAVYLGPVLALLGVAGLAIWAYRAMKHNNALALPGLLVVVAASILFMVKTNISPDQIWASRRLLSIVMPGLVAFAVVSLDYLSVIKLPGLYRKLLISVVCGLVILGPLLVSRPFLTARSYVPQLSQVNGLCSALPENAAVLWAGNFSANAIHSTKAFCDVPSAGINEPTAEKLQQAGESARQAGYVPIVAVVESESAIVGTGIDMTPVSSVEYQTMELTLVRPPKKMIQESRTILLGEIDTGAKAKETE